jgi:hypothetical protein
MTDERENSSLPKPVSTIRFQFKSTCSTKTYVSSSSASVAADSKNRKCYVSFNVSLRTFSLKEGIHALASSSVAPAVFKSTHEQEEEEGETHSDAVQSIRVIEGSFIPKHEEKKEKPKLIIPMSVEDQEAAKLLLQGKRNSSKRDR